MKKLKLFISYSHKDDVFRQEFEKWLAVLKDKGLIESWFDGNIIPGDQLVSKIFRQMDDADIVVLFLSQDYLASNSCKEEMRYALNSQHKKVVPVVLRECAWLDTECKNLLALPKDGKPVSKWDNEEDAWRSVYEGMKEVVKELLNKFDVSFDFVQELNRVEFVTQSRKNVTLNDIFVFPSLSLTKDAFQRENIDFDFFSEKKKKLILIRGREFSGKSAFLKWLFVNLEDRFSPIFLDGNEIRKTLNFDDHFKREFRLQRSGSFDEWINLKDKVALIDNFNHRISQNILSYLNDNYSMTVVAVEDEEYLLYFKDDPSFAEFSVLNLTQFDLVKQEELIRKWFQVSRQSDSSEISDLDIDKLEARVNNVVTVQRIVPRYPFYILSILQSLENFMPSDIRITAYGHCYQALITAQLVKKNIKYEDLDTSFNYLRNLAYSIYAKTVDGGVYSKSEYLDFRASYKEKFIISEALINKIENNDYAVLNVREDMVSFEHSYIYYFFLGMYLAFAENEKVIDELCEKVYLRQNAFILIFTIHHTQNRVLLDTIRLHCVYSFEGIKPAELSADETRFMSNIISELPKSIISNNSTSKNRAEQRRNNDKALVVNDEDDFNGEAQTKASDKNMQVIEVNKGIRIMEVLGQILKNRAGSFERKDVEEILENTVDLGLRILNIFLSECREPGFEEWLKRSLEEAEKESEEAGGKRFDDQKRKKFIEGAIQFFGYVVTVSMLNRISDAVASEKLTDSMLALSNRKGTPAYELVNYLVASSQDGVDSNYVRSLLEKYNKTKNYWTERALSYYVQNYLNTHNVEYKERQKLFKALNIKYLPNKN